jgi:hypothetical protein
VGCDSEYQKKQIEKLNNGYFKEFLMGSKPDSEKTVKKEASFGVPQEVPLPQLLEKIGEPYRNRTCNLLIKR